MELKSNPSYAVKHLYKIPFTKLNDTVDLLLW